VEINVLVKLCNIEMILTLKMKMFLTLKTLKHFEELLNRNEEGVGDAKHGNILNSY